MTRVRKTLVSSAAALAIATGFAALPLALPTAVAAAPSDPAAAQIDAFDSALLGVMKDAKTLGVQGRYHRLEPAVSRAFDTATMARFAAGPAWTSATPAQQQALQAAFYRLTVAGYAHNFSGYSGEKFSIDPNVIPRGAGKVVVSHIVAAGQGPVTIDYLMQSSGGEWKVVDVVYNGISQLATRRSDFAATAASGGATALIAHINALVDKQLK